VTSGRATGVAEAHGLRANEADYFKREEVRMDVLDMLKKDHQAVTKLFQRFKDEENARARSALVEKICEELDTHTRIEEELFYPAVEDSGDADLDRMVGEARQEHEQVKERCRMLREAIASEEADGLDDEVSALEQDVEHHVTEEEGEMFPRVEEFIDVAQRTEIARRAQARKTEMTGEASGGRASRPAATRSGATKGSRGRARSTKQKRAKGTKTAKRAKTVKASRSRGRATGAKKRARGGRR